MNALREYRMKKNFSICDLSKDTGISERYLRFIETGEKTPSLMTAKRIADSLNSTIDEIFFK